MNREETTEAIALLRDYGYNGLPWNDDAGGQFLTVHDGILPHVALYTLDEVREWLEGQSSNHRAWGE